MASDLPPFIGTPGLPTGPGKRPTPPAPAGELVSFPAPPASAGTPFPTVPAPKTLTGSTPRSSGRVVVFSGPKEGVGKSSIALNLALAWAGTQSRNVLIVQLDPLCRSDLSFQLGLQPPTLASLTQFVGKDVAVLSKLLKGRIPLSQWGVGVLPLGSKRSEVLQTSPHVIVPILESLSQSYDLFLDVDPYFPMQVFSFDLADLVFWTCLPQRGHFESTYALFQEFKALHFPLERFEVVLNEANLPGALAPKEVDRFFANMNKRVLSYMPWEDLLPEFANTGRILVVEQPHSDWAKALRPLLGKMLETPSGPKAWGHSAVEEHEFSEGSNLLWKPTASSMAGPGGEAKAKPIARPTDLPAFWDELKMKMHGHVVAAMETERIRISDSDERNAEVRQKIAAIIESLLQKEANLPLSRDLRQRFVAELLDEILGLGPLEELMRDSAVNEIMVNAPDKVYIERGGKLVLTSLRFRDDEQIIQVIKRIVAPIGRRIDESVPLVDARLKDGSRVNAIIPPLAVSGPTLTIRRFSKTPFSGKDLIRFGSVNEELLDFMQACVRVRKSIIISGGTGTGKTTFLNMLSSSIPEDERIITVEDTAELKLLQEHWIRLESRPPNIEGKGEVTIRDLVKNCLRMRPDRIVVGECRGSEALDMLQAMNTGHEGSLATIHANSPRDALTRLEAMCMMASADLPIWALREMIASAVHLVVQITRFPDGKRRCTWVTEVTGRDQNTILTNDLFRYVATGVDADGKTQGFFSGCGKPPKFYEEFRLAGLNIPPELFKKHPEYAQYEARNAL